MNAFIYQGLMDYSKKNKSGFQSLMNAGNFFFEGRADYQTKMIVFTVSSGTSRRGTHVLTDWLKPDEKSDDDVREDVGEKRKLKRGERGPGKKDYARATSIN